MVNYESGYAYINGYKFKKDSKTGYYLSSKKIDGKRKRLHIYVWEKHNKCEVPKGYEIHHYDMDKDNNDISNLMCMNRKAHLEWHNENDSRYYENRVITDEAREKAKEWHKSEEGRTWHREQALRSAENPIYGEFKCDQCGNTYTAKTNGEHRFCSPACRTKHRYLSGVDNETRQCVVCDNDFTVNKYSKKKTCCKSCATKLTIQNRS